MANEEAQRLNGASQQRTGNRVIPRALMLYGTLSILVCLTVAVLILVMYGSDRLALKQQLLGAWSSDGATTPQGQALDLVLFDDGTYRWNMENTSPAVIHRGHYHMVGADHLSFVDDAMSGAERFTAATDTYTVRVVADQLTLRNARQTLVVFRAGN